MIRLLNLPFLFFPFQVFHLLTDRELSSFSEPLFHVICSSLACVVPSAPQAAQRAGHGNSQQV